VSTFTWTDALRNSPEWLRDSFDRLRGSSDRRRN
jgi:hypothetical protein